MLAIFLKADEMFGGGEGSGVILNSLSREIDADFAQIPAVPASKVNIAREGSRGLFCGNIHGNS